MTNTIRTLEHVMSPETNAKPFAHAKKNDSITAHLYDRTVRLMNDLSFEIVKEKSEMLLLRDEWQALASSFQTPLLQYEWFTSCAEMLQPSERLHFAVVRQHGSLSAVAPLVVANSGMRKKLEIAGATVLSEPTGFLYANLQSLDYLIDCILALRLPMMIKRFPIESPEFTRLKRKIREKGIIRLESISASPWIPIQSEWKQFEKNISSHWQSTLRRAQRRAQEFGAVTTEIVSPAQHEIRLYMNEILDVEHASWKGREGTSIRSHQSLQKFFEAYVAAIQPAGILRLCFLRIDGKTVAAQIAVEYANRFWVLKIGFNEAFKKCSPGILLMHQVIQYAFEKKLEAFEFLGQNESWLQLWTDKTHLYSSVWMYPVSGRGALCLAEDASQLIVKKIKQHYRWKKR